LNAASCDSTSRSVSVPSGMAPRCSDDRQVQAVARVDRHGDVVGRGCRRGAGYARVSFRGFSVGYAGNWHELGRESDRDVMRRFLNEPVTGVHLAQLDRISGLPLPA
jgi:hypothetical protein